MRPTTAHDVFVALCLAAAPVLAQDAEPASAASAASAQQTYERRVAACNGGGLPAPARDACVRDAGAALDRLRGGPPVGANLTTPDGRATVIAPPGASLRSSEAPPSIAPPDGADGTRTTPDGRATIVQP